MEKYTSMQILHMKCQWRPYQIIFIAGTINNKFWHIMYSIGLNVFTLLKDNFRPQLWHTIGRFQWPIRAMASHGKFYRWYISKSTIFLLYQVLLMKETGYALPFMGIGVTALALIQLSSMVDQSLPITRIHFHCNINSN